MRTEVEVGFLHGVSLGVARTVLDPHVAGRKGEGREGVVHRHGQAAARGSLHELGNVRLKRQMAAGVADDLGRGEVSTGSDRCDCSSVRGGGRTAVPSTHTDAA